MVAAQAKRTKFSTHYDDSYSKYYLSISATATRLELLFFFSNVYTQLLLVLKFAVLCCLCQLGKSIKRKNGKAHN